MSLPALARADEPVKKPDVVVAPNEEELARKAAEEDLQRRRHGETDSDRLFGLAHPHYALDIGLSEGLAQDTSGIHTMILGAMYPLADTHVSIDAQLMLDSWTQWNPHMGIFGYGFGGTLGLRIDPWQRQLRGVTLDVGAAYMFLLDGAHKRISDNGFGQASIGSNAFAGRVGLAYGFPTSRSVTMVVHLDAYYWFLDLAPFAPEFEDPYPHTITMHLGLEFLIWRQ